MFYSYVGISGNSLFHRYIDDSGNRKNEVIRTFPISLYVESPKGEHLGFDGAKLGKVDFSSVADAEEFISEYEAMTRIYGQTSLVHQFISHRYPEVINFNIDQCKIAFIDIETDSSKEFPEPWAANQEITAISFKLRNKDQVYVFCRFDYKPKENELVFWAESEKEMLELFLKSWCEIYPEIISGYNCSGYDVVYIVNRLQKVLGEGEAAKLSPFHKNIKRVLSEKQLRNSDKKTIEILGITVLDYLELYKKFSGNTLEKYSLDFVCYHELGEKKLDYAEYKSLASLYEQNPQLYIEYNIRDTLLVEKLDAKLNFLFIALSMTYLAKICHREVYSPVKFWDNYIYSQLEKQGVVIPPISKKETRGIKGGFVKEPRPGKYNWVVSFDLTSLYPSIMMAYNMSPETYRAPATGDYVAELTEMNIDLSDLKKKNFSMTANGAMFDRAFTGLVPTLIEGMFNNRKKYKGEMLQAKSTLQNLKPGSGEATKLKNHIASLSAMEQAIKIALNSNYGVQANPHFRYFNEDIAEGITMTGQLTIQYISKHLNQFLQPKFKTNKDLIAFSDTDSTGIDFQPFVESIGGGALSDVNKIADIIDLFCKKEVEPFIAQKFHELEDYLNAAKPKMHMKREKIANGLIIRGKKNYVIQVIDSEGVRFAEPVIVPVGIEIVRSSTPEFSRSKLFRAVGIILNGTEDELIEFVSETKREFFAESIENIAFPRGISDIAKWQDNDSGWLIRTPIHVKAAITYNNLLKKTGLSQLHPPIKNFDKIKFVYLKIPNPTLNNCVAFTDVLYPEFELEEFIDRDAQFEKAFLGPLASLADIIGWSLEKRNKLHDLFSGNELSYEVTSPAVEIKTKKPQKPYVKKKSLVRKTPPPTLFELF